MDRRNFLVKSSLLSAAAIAPLTLGANEINPHFDMPARTFGIQLYSVRKDMEKDPKSALKKLASYGYKHLEGYEGSKGLFWGMSHTDFKSYLDDLGMKMIASHCGETEDLEGFKKKCDKAAEIGIDYLMCPGLPRDLEVDIFKGHADRFNKNGEIARSSGIKFAYHNHSYTFTKVDGVYLQDVLMENTDSKLVDFELDIYWVVVAGQDPIAWFDKYPKRFKYCHVKDALNVGGRIGYESCTLGKGEIDFQKILSHGKKRGLKHLIVEQEAYQDSTPMEAASDNANYMRNLKV